MENPLLELYSDYLLSSFAQTTATGLSRLLDNAYSHDQITRFLAGAELTSRDLWRLAKKPAKPLRPTACSFWKMMKSVSMSGSLSTWLGWAWCRVCLLIHQE